MNIGIFLIKNSYEVYFMKQLIFFTAVILLGCVMVSAVVIPANAQQENIAKVMNAMNEEKDDTYLLKTNNGQLCVYLKVNGQLIMNTETNVSVLPKEDQELLKKGIGVKDEIELQQALEDYCS